MVKTYLYKFLVIIVVFSAPLIAMKRSIEEIYDLKDGVESIAKKIAQSRYLENGIHFSSADLLAPNCKRECIACCHVRQPSQFFKFNCGQYDVCFSCINDLVTNALKFKTPDYLKCSNPRCKKPFSWHELQQLATDKDLQTINQIMFDHYLTIANDIKYCPNPRCGYAFVAGDQKCKISCVKCKASFCSGCYIDHYWITPCSLAQYLHSDTTAFFIHEKIGQCPSCKHAVEKEEKGKCDTLTCPRCGCVFIMDYFNLNLNEK